MPEDGAVLAFGYTGILKTAPHPNAAKLLMNFIEFEGVLAGSHHHLPLSPARRRVLHQRLHARDNEDLQEQRGTPRHGDDGGNPKVEGRIRRVGRHVLGQFLRSPDAPRHDRGPSPAARHQRPAAASRCAGADHDGADAARLAGLDELPFRRHRPCHGAELCRRVQLGGEPTRDRKLADPGHGRRRAPPRWRARCSLG